MSVKHSKMTAAKGNHVVQRWVAQDASARAALTLDALDIGGVCRQLSDGTWWRLDNNEGPVWTQWGGAVVVPVPSVFGRTGAIVAAAGDYTSTLITNLSTATGSTVTEALTYLMTTLTALAVTVGTRIGLSNLSVANGAALASVNAPDGTPLYARTFRDTFIYRAASTATVDSKLVFAAFGGTGRWERALAFHPSWARMDDIYVDPVAGNDENEGIVSAPLKTFGEILRRLGYRYHARNYNADTDTGRSQRFWVLGDLGLEAIAWDLSQDRNVTLYIKGVLSAPVFTGTVSAVTALNVATNTPAAATSTWTPATELGRLVKSGTSYSWVSKDNGGSSARLAPWAAEDQYSNVFAMAAGTAPVVSGTITTHTLPSKIAYLNLRIAGGNSSRGVLIEDIDITTYLSLAANGGQHIFNRCDIRASIIRYVGATFGFNNCQLRGGFGGAPGNETASQNYYNGGVVRSALANGGKGSEITLTSGVLFQGASYVLAGYSVLRTAAGGALFMDIAGDAVTLQSNSVFWNRATLGGAGITGYGVRFQCSQLVMDSGVVNSITGTLGDFCFGRASGVPATKNVSRAYDTSTGLEGTARTLSWTNFVATYASGGFAGSILDRDTGCQARVF